MTPLSVRFAIRELRGGVRGFRIFLACLALGVAAIAAAGSTAEAFRQGLAAESRSILGGDLAVTRQERRFTEDERAVIGRRGPMTDAVATRAMAEGPAGERRLVELRGVDKAYPLAGSVEVQGGGAFQPLLADRDGVAGALVEQTLLERLGLRVGDQFTVGRLRLSVRGVVLSEPDRLSRGFQLGPRILTRLDVPDRASAVAVAIRRGLLE